MKARDLIEAGLLFDAEPLVHPNVLDAYRQAVRVLKRANIPYRETGGIALNLHGAGRPTKDVDLIVRRSDWLRAIKALGQIATDRQGIRFGLPQEQEPALAVVGPHAVPIEVWPEGTTHEQIARIRGMRKTRLLRREHSPLLSRPEAVTSLLAGKRVTIPGKLFYALLQRLDRHVAAELRAVEMDLLLSLSDYWSGGYYRVSERPNRLTRPRTVSMT